jgi:hypothetical protein
MVQRQAIGAERGESKNTRRLVRDCCGRYYTEEATASNPEFPLRLTAKKQRRLGMQKLKSLAQEKPETAVEASVVMSENGWVWLSGLVG